MTCIVAIAEKGKVYMGADSAGSNSITTIPRKDSKIFRNNGFLFGITSSFRMGQILRFRLTCPHYKGKKELDSLYQFMCTDFIDSVRNSFKDYGYGKIENNEESGGSFLVGFEGHLFEVYDDFQIAMSIDNYASIGSGEQFARGSLFSTKGMKPNKRLKLALKAATRFSPTVSKPFVLEKLG